MLSRITRLQQMFWRSFPGQHNKLSRPVCLCSDPRLPCHLRQRGFFADIVDTPSRLVRGCSKRDRMRNVLHISPRPSPSREIIGKQYGRSSVSEALEQGEESMKRISRTIHHGQSENRSRDPGAVQYGLFRCDLVITFVHPTKDALHHFHGLWWVE